MRRTRDLFKKTGDIKGTFHARMDMTKDRNSKALTEAGEDAARMHRRTVQKRCDDLDNHDGVVTHLEPDILEVKSSGPQEALLSVKLVEVIEFQLNNLKN